MLVSQRSTICLLILGLIVCPSLSKAEEGFLFRNQQKTTGSARYYSGVEPYALQAQLPTLPTEPAAKEPAKAPAATPAPAAPAPAAPQATTPASATPKPATPAPAAPKAATPAPATPKVVTEPKPNPVPPAAAKPVPVKPTPIKPVPVKPIPPSDHIMPDTMIGDSCAVGDDCCASTCGQQGSCSSGCNGGCGLGYDCCGEKDFFRSGNFYIRGWIDQGATFNSMSPKDRTNESGYNWRSNEYMMNQLYTIIGRDVTANGCFWDAGGRVDTLYGTDYRYTQALGLETHKAGGFDNTARWNSQTPGGQEAIYGFSMPQLYAEFAVPMAQGTTFKFGHFYSLIGYESPMAPQNFFYSHSYARVYGEPTTETGMLASSKISPNVVVHGGFSQGWNIWESPMQALTFIGGVCWTSHDDRTSVGFAIDTGQNPTVVNPQTGIVTETGERTILSLVISQQFGTRWTYIFQYDFGSQQGAFTNLQDQPQTANWYGINNYLFYALSDTLSAGMRMEWFCDADRYIIFDAAGIQGWSGTDCCELTIGLNWQPNDCIIVRPELRWDWSNVKGPDSIITGLPARLYNDFHSSYQFLFATDLIVRF